MKYFKISTENNQFHIGIGSLNDNSILNLITQNIILGYKTETSTEQELKDYYESLTKQEQFDNDLMYEHWDSEINWDIIFSD